MFMSTFLPAAFSFTGNRKKVHIQTLWERQICRWVQVVITAGEQGQSTLWLAAAWCSYCPLLLPEINPGAMHACESSKIQGS